MTAAGQGWRPVTPNERIYMNNYQEVFNEAYDNLSEETHGRYGRLVYALEATFQAAGYTITGAELAGDWHNYVCGYIGITDLATIAKGFVSHAAEPPRLPYELEKVAAGELKYDSYLYSGSIFRPEILAGYGYQIDTQLKKDGIRRKTKPYNAFIKAEAAQVGNAMRLDAQTGLERHLAVKADYLKAEMELNLQAVEYIIEINRLIEVIAAFTVIGALSTTASIRNKLDAFVAKIYAGIARRESVMGALASQVHDLDTMITEAVSAPRYSDLAALWSECLAQEKAHA
jgi:hypothetical protein